MDFQEASNTANTAQFLIGSVIDANIHNIFNVLPDNLKKAKELSKETSDSIHDNSQSEHLLNAIDLKLPDFKTGINNLDLVQNAINERNGTLDENIKKIECKISHSRDLVSRIRVGMTFFPNTTLELRNPVKSLSSLTTSINISFYFRTNESNGFLLYLGNDNGNMGSRIKSVSYCTFTWI